MAGRKNDTQGDRGTEQAGERSGFLRIRQLVFALTREEQWSLLVVLLLLLTGLAVRWFLGAR